jgi:hypothetical protein
VTRVRVGACRPKKTSRACLLGQGPRNELNTSDNTSRPRAECACDVLEFCRKKRKYMRKSSLAWVLVASTATLLTALSACGGNDSADGSSAGTAGATSSGGSANGGSANGGSATAGGSSAVAGSTATAGASAGGTTAAGGTATGGATGVAGKGGAATGGGTVGGAANAGAPGAAGATSGEAGAGGAADCNNACVGGRPFCDVASQTCVECLVDTDCKDPGKPGCLPATHRCEDCSKNSQCPTDKPTCDLTRGQCQ